MSWGVGGGSCHVIQYGILFAYSLACLLIYYILLSDGLAAARVVWGFENDGGFLTVFFSGVLVRG